MSAEESFASLSCQAQTTKLDTHATKEILIPVLLEGKHHRALLDTGCEVSFMTPECARKLQLKVQPTTGTIKLAQDRFTMPQVGITKNKLDQKGGGQFGSGRFG